MLRVRAGIRARELLHERGRWRLRVVWLGGVPRTCGSATLRQKPQLEIQNSMTTENDDSKQDASSLHSLVRGQLVSLGDLRVGDRFLAYGSLWTYLGNDGRDNLTARKHSPESINLAARGYGYIGDTICSFERSERVEFVAPNAGNAQHRARTTNGD
jgi:hypothetical protein